MLNTPEIERFSIAIGALAAMAWKDRRGVIPGGIVVPGFLVNALLLSAPWCLAIILVSVITQAIYQRWLERAEYQRRQPMYILGALSLLLSTPIAWLLIQAGLLPASLDSVTGTFLPGVIAFNHHRQGLKRVMGGMLAVTAITALSTGLLVWISSKLLHLDFHQLNHYYLHADKLRLRAQLLQFLVTLGVGSLLYKRTGMRPGGYMVAPIAASLLLEPLSAGMFAFGCLAVETGIRWLMRNSLIIGLQRYVFALLLSIGYVWGMELIFIQLGMEALPFQGNHLLVIVAILSYANDAVLEGVWRVLPWMMVMLGSSLLSLLLTRQLLALFA
jgi:hypothetical protein